MPAEPRSKLIGVGWKNESQVWIVNTGVPVPPLVT